MSCCEFPCWVDMKSRDGLKRVVMARAERSSWAELDCSRAVVEPWLTVVSSLRTVLSHQQMGYQMACHQMRVTRWVTRGVTRSQEPPVTKQRNHQKHQRGKKYLRVVRHTHPQSCIWRKVHFITFLKFWTNQDIHNYLIIVLSSNAFLFTVLW